MKSINYKTIHPISGERTNTNHTLAEFLLSLPTLFYFGYIPSLETINLFLSTGLEEADMSGGLEWKPFKINGSDYEKVLKSLKSKNYLGKIPFKFNLINVKVESKEAWYSKVLEREWGVPFEKHLSMTLRADKLREMSLKTEDDKFMMQYHLEWIEVSEQLLELEESCKSINFQKGG